MFGAIGGAISSIVSQVTSGQEINWKAVGISAASGAISGAITAACPCMGPVAAGVVQGTLSAATYAVTEKVAYGRDPSLGETLKVGFISGVTAGVTQYVGQELGLIQCFIAGTIVAAKDGPKKIEDIQPGDFVWATDPNTGETDLKEVKQLFRNETDEWIHITVNDEEIVCTPNHPFWVPVKGWTKACHLRAGDRLQLLNGKYVVVEQIQHELLERPETTYNFEVEKFHTYYVGLIGVLAHNLGCKGVGNKGWEGDKTWRANVETVNHGGTITSLNGGIPTQVQGEKLITQSGGTLLRAELGHEFPNPHTYPHINFLTASGKKGALQILLEGFIEKRY